VRVRVRVRVRDRDRVSCLRVVDLEQPDELVN